MMTSSLSNFSAATFVAQLREAYITGDGKAGAKFRALRHAITAVLPTAPEPGPGTFTVRSVEAALVVPPPYNEGLSHMIIASFADLSESHVKDEDMELARAEATSILMKAVVGASSTDSRILVRLVVVFKIGIDDVRAWGQGEAGAAALTAAAAAVTPPLGPETNAGVTVSPPLATETTDTLAGSWAVSPPLAPETTVPSAVAVAVSPLSASGTASTPTVAESSEPGKREVEEEEDGVVPSFEERAVDAVRKYIRALVDQKVYTSSVALMKGLGLNKLFSDNFLSTLLDEGRAELAGDWAEHVGSDTCVRLIESAREKEQFKVAHRLVEKYGMEAQFPDSYILYRKSSITKLAKKGLWDLAETFVETDKELQQHLVSVAIAEGMPAKAVEIAERLGLSFPPELEGVDLSAGDVSATEKYLSVSSLIPNENVAWVDSPEVLSDAAAHLLQAPEVGLDCEWRAIRSKGDTQRVAVLQLATRERAFVIDMLGLVERHPVEVEAALGPVLSSPTVLKLGYAVSMDLSMMASSYPDMGCFTRFKRVLDLQSLAGPGMRGGLSELVRVVTGLPLSKQVRMTNWEERPLTREQLLYAALDALCLLPVFDALQNWGGDGDMLSALQSPLPPPGSEPTEQSLPVEMNEGDVASAADGVPAQRGLSQSTRMQAAIAPEGGPRWKSFVFDNEPKPLKVKDDSGEGTSRVVDELATAGVNPSEYRVVPASEIGSATAQPVECVPVVVASLPTTVTRQTDFKARLDILLRRLQVTTENYRVKWEPRTRTFTASVEVGGWGFTGPASKQKKVAEQLAAKSALESLCPMLQAAETEYMESLGTSGGGSFDTFGEVKAEAVGTLDEGGTDVDAALIHDGKPYKLVYTKVLLIVPEGGAIDPQKVISLLGRSYPRIRSVRRVSHAQCRAVWGFNLAGMPPFGHLSPPAISLIDSSLLRPSRTPPACVLCRCGDSRFRLELDVHTLQRMTRATTGNILLQRMDTELAGDSEQSETARSAGGADLPPPTQSEHADRDLCGVPEAPLMPSTREGEIEMAEPQVPPWFDDSSGHPSLSSPYLCPSSADFLEQGRREASCRLNEAQHREGEETKQSSSAESVRDGYLQHSGRPNQAGGLRVLPGKGGEDWQTAVKLACWGLACGQRSALPIGPHWNLLLAAPLSVADSDMPSQRARLGRASCFGVARPRGIPLGKTVLGLRSASLPPFRTGSGNPSWEEKVKIQPFVGQRDWRTPRGSLLRETFRGGCLERHTRFHQVLARGFRVSSSRLRICGGIESIFGKARFGAIVRVSLKGCFC